MTKNALEKLYNQWKAAGSIPSEIELKPKDLDYLIKRIEEARHSYGLLYKYNAIPEEQYLKEMDRTDKLMEEIERRKHEI